MDGAYDIIDSSNASYQTMRAFTAGWIDKTGATTDGGIMAALEECVAVLGEAVFAGLDEIRIKKRVLTGEPEEGDVLAEFFSNENSKILEINRRLASYPKAFQKMVMFHDAAHADLDIWTLGTVSEGFAEAAAIISHIGETLRHESQDGRAEILRTLEDLVKENPTDANKVLLEIHNDAFELAQNSGDTEAYEALFEPIIDYVRTYWYPDDVMLSQPLDTLKLTMEAIFDMMEMPEPAAILADGYIPEKIPLFDITGEPLLENWHDLILDHPDYAWRILSKMMTSAAKNVPGWFLNLVVSCINEIGEADSSTPDGRAIIENLAKTLDSVIPSATMGEMTFGIDQTAIDKINIALGIAPHREHPAELALKSKIILVSVDHPSYAGKPDIVKWDITSAKRVHGYIHFVQQACKGALENAAYRLSREEKLGGQPVQIVLDAGTFSSRIEALRALIGYPADPAEASDVSVLREAMAMFAEMEILMEKQPDEVDLNLWNDLHKALGNVKVEVTGPGNPARAFYLSRIIEVQALQRRINKIMREALPVPSGVLPSMASAYPQCLLERSELLPYDSPADPDTDPDVVVGHAYDTLGFVNFASRDAAFTALSDPVTQPSEIGGIIVATAETIDGVLHFTLEDGTKVVVVPHAHRPILFFHVINEAAVPDITQLETISASVQEAAEGLAADSIPSVFDSMFSAADPAVRIAACETLGLLGTHEAIQILLDHLAAELDPAVITAASQALNSIGISSEANIPLEDGVYRASQDTMKKIADGLGVWYDSTAYPNGPPGLTLGNGLVLLLEGASASIYTFIHEASHAIFATIFSDDSLKDLLVTSAITALDTAGIIANLRTLLNIPATKDAVFILNETLALLAEFNALEIAGALLPAQETLFTSLKTILQLTYQPDISGYVSSIPELQALRGKMDEIRDIHVTPGLLNAIAAGCSVKRFDVYDILTKSLIVAKYYVYDEGGNLVKIYAYEPYVDSFWDQTIEFMDSTEHDAMHRWVNEKTGPGGDWPEDCILINFDRHTDNNISPFSKGPTFANWAGYLKNEGKIGEYWWIYRYILEAAAIKPDFETNDLAELIAKNVDKPLIITIDLDYLISYDYPKNTTAKIDANAEGIVNALKALIAKGCEIKGVNITRSRGSIHHRQETYAYEKLVQELQGLPGFDLGPAKRKMRLRSIEYTGIPLGFLEIENAGEDMVCLHVDPWDMYLPVLKLALTEENPLIRIDACRIIGEIDDMPEAAQTLFDHLKTETNFAVNEGVVVALDTIGIESIPDIYYDENIIQNLVNLLASTDSAVREAAARLLGAIQSVIALQKTSVQVAIDAGQTLSAEYIALLQKEDNIVNEILPSLDSGKPLDERIGAAYALGMAGNKLAVQPLVDIISDNAENPNLKEAVALALESTPIVYGGTDSVFYAPLSFFTNLAGADFGKDRKLKATDRSYVFRGGAIFILDSLKDTQEAEGLIAHETGHIVFNYQLDIALQQALTVSGTEPFVISTSSTPNKMIRMSTKDPFGLIDFFNISFDEDPDGIIPQETGHDIYAVLSAQEIKDIRRALLEVVDPGNTATTPQEVNDALKVLFGTEVEPGSKEYAGHEIRIVGELMEIWNECKVNSPVSGSALETLYNLIDAAKTRIEVLPITEPINYKTLITELGLDNPMFYAVGLSPRFADRALAAKGLSAPPIITITGLDSGEANTIRKNLMDAFDSAKKITVTGPPLYGTQNTIEIDIDGIKFTVNSLKKQEIIDAYNVAERDFSMRRATNKVLGITTIIAGLGSIAVLLKKAFETEPVEPMINDSVDIIHARHHLEKDFIEWQDYVTNRMKSAKEAKPSKKVVFLCEYAGLGYDASHPIAAEVLRLYKENPDEARKRFEESKKRVAAALNMFIKGEITEDKAIRPSGYFSGIFELLREMKNAGVEVEIILEDVTIENWMVDLMGETKYKFSNDYFIDGDFERYKEMQKESYLAKEAAYKNRDDLLREQIEDIMRSGNVYCFSMRGNHHIGVEKGLTASTYDVSVKHRPQEEILARQTPIGRLRTMKRLGIPISTTEEESLMLKSAPTALLSKYFDDRKIDHEKKIKLINAILDSPAVTDEVIREFSTHLGSLTISSNEEAAIKTYQWFDSQGLIPQLVKTMLTIASGAGGITRATREDEKCVMLIEGGIVEVTEHMGEGTATTRLSEEYQRIDAILVEYMSTALDPAAVQLEIDRRLALFADNARNLKDGIVADNLYSIFNDVRSVFFNDPLIEAGKDPDSYNINIRLVTGNDRLMHWERTQDGLTYTIAIDVDALRDMSVLREELAGELFKIGRLIIKDKIPPSEDERDAFRDILQRTPDPSQFIAMLSNLTLSGPDKEALITPYIKAEDLIDAAQFLQIFDYIMFEAADEVETDIRKITCFNDPDIFTADQQAHYLATLLADNQIDDHKFSEILARSMAGQKNWTRFFIVIGELERILAGEEFGPARGMTREKIEEIINSLQKMYNDEKKRAEELTQVPGSPRRLALAYGSTQEYDEDGVFTGGVYSWEIGLCIKAMHTLLKRVSFTANKDPQSGDIISFECCIDGRPKAIYYPNGTMFVEVTYDEEGNITNIDSAITTLIDIISTEIDPIKIKAAAHTLNSIPQSGTFLEYGVHFVSQDVLNKIATALPSLVTGSNPRGLAMKCGVILILENRLIDPGFVANLAARYGANFWTDAQAVLDLINGSDPLPADPGWKADLIIVAGSDHLEPPIEAARLYLQGKADRILVS
ncbi:MAG: HEAT repeat domain-containing protein, partial [Planctomycetota bacterium]